jgi:kynurenine formamidase
LTRTRLCSRGSLALVVAIGVIPFLAAGEPKGALLDMTYPFDNASIYWPTATPFRLTQVSWGVTPGGWWYASNDFSASEHGGTHADAPIHFARGGRTMEQVPLAEWIGPAVKVDVTAKCRSNRDYLLTKDDVLGWETKHGRIPPHAWVIMQTGIDAAYPGRKDVLGTEKTGAQALPELSFPGFSDDVVSFLLAERSITGIAIDTPSIDYGKSTDFKVHRVLCGAGKLALENLANVEKLPASGATLYVIPMLIRGGSGAPARVFAILP